MQNKKKRKVNSKYQPYKNNYRKWWQPNVPPTKTHPVSETAPLKISNLKNNWVSRVVAATQAKRVWPRLKT
jgi:hypothetical protein